MFYSKVLVQDHLYFAAQRESREQQEHTLKQSFCKKRAQCERVPCKQLMDFKETILSHHNLYKQIDWIFFPSYKFVRNHHTRSFPVANINMERINTVKQTAVKNIGMMCTKFNITSIPFSKYLMEHNFHQTNLISQNTAAYLLHPYQHSTSVLTEGVVIIKPESHSFNRAAGRSSGARLQQP